MSDEINSFLLKRVLSAKFIGFPTDNATIERVKTLLPASSRHLLCETDLQIGIDDDVLDDINMTLSLHDGRLDSFSEKISSVLKERK